MRKFTNKFLYATILLAGLTLFTFSCKKDKTPDRDKFLGAYSVVETCGSGNDSYDITVIESGTAENAVVIVNLYDAGQQWTATVNGDNITIPTQVVSATTWSGSGSIAGNSLTISFTGSNSGVSDNCTAICTRK
ncbi:MAG: hypothetical protein IPL65_20715 [Lewinellaceae bacterium]|nr:hypothetical protein [Lewinellaceae bacterium]